MLVFTLGNRDDQGDTILAIPPETTTPEIATPAPVVENTPEITESRVLTASEVFEINRDAVIIIRTEYGGGLYGTGSGFFVSSTGVAVTNHHVLADAISATAILYDESEFNITGYYSYDIENDLAIIQVDGRGGSFDYVTLGDSDTTAVGETVYAIGGPDWDPITFTQGMISRIVYEPIIYDIYTIAGMLQSTAAIYGGNSGGPLVNDRGQVIGVNSAGHTIRASVQMAVPINRVVLPPADAPINPLPIGMGIAPPQHAAGYVFAYEQFPFIPDFISISHHGTFLFGGTPANLGLSSGDVIYDFYDHLFIYDLPRQHWIADTDAYDEVLIENGFFLQDIVHYDDEIWVYFFHQERNTSLSYGFFPNMNNLLVAVVRGNVYELYYHGGIAQVPESPPQQQEITHESDLIGTWNWMGTPYYVFNGDGTGIMADDIINWWVSDGILSICWTPSVCGNNCPTPLRWQYTISGNSLTLVNVTNPDISYVYTRR